MTEKRYEYCRGKYRHYIQDVEKDGVWREGSLGTYGEFDLDKITERLNKFDSENKRLKIKNKGLQSELQIFKEDVEYNNKICNKLSEENEQLKSDIKLIEERADKVYDENEQLKTQIKIFEKFLDENNLDIDWEIFCTVDECKKDSDDYGCKECKYLGDVE